MWNWRNSGDGQIGAWLFVVFGGHRAHELRMEKGGFDDTDYSVVVKIQGISSEPVEVGDLSRR